MANGDNNESAYLQENVFLMLIVKFVEHLYLGVVPGILTSFLSRLTAELMARMDKGF